MPKTFNREANLLTIDEILAVLRIRRNTLHQMIQRGDFPPGIRVGRRFRRWPEETVVSWMENGGSATVPSEGE